MQEVFQGVRNAVIEEKMAVLFLHAGADSWILPFFQIEKLRVIPRPDLTEMPILTGLVDEGKSAGLLILNLSFSPEEGKGWSIYRRFTEADSALYLWRNP